nr:Excision repair cross-complementation group 1 [Polyrhizophydium stewartii]
MAARLHAVGVNANQRGNPVLAAIRNVPWQHTDTPADYQVGRTTGVVYLSLRYHRVHPEYIAARLRALENKFQLRLLLCLVDIDDHQQHIRELTRMCILNNLTMIVAWSPEEAARYIETLKAYENKPPDMLKGQVDPDYFSRLADSLTAIKSVNKTDAMTLSSSIGSFRDMAHASAQELQLLPGFGEQKAARFESAFKKPFLIGAGGSGLAGTGDGNTRIAAESSGAAEA